MTTSDKPQGIGLAEAAAQFEALADNTSDTQAPEDTAPPTSDTQADTEQVEASAQAETSEEKTPPSDNDDTEDADDSIEAETDDEEGAEEDEATTDEDDTADPEKLLSQTFTVKISGKEEKVTLKEALAGYQRTADYTRSKMALSEEKKAFVSEREAVTVERGQYAQLLPILVQQLEAGMEKEPDWDDLITNDPAEYVRQEKLWREKQGRLAAAREEQKRLGEEKQAEARRELETAIRKSGQELGKLMPAWKEPQRWEADRAKLMEYGTKLGFSPEEMGQTYDHRAVMALYKAMRYDELMAKKPVPVKQPSPKPVSSGSAASRATRKPSDLQRAKQRLATSGRVRDAASLFEQLDP
jgi:hypothetical protein